MANPQTYECGTPKVDADGREIVRIASAEHEDGWRFGYKDEMLPEHKQYTGKIKAPDTSAVTVKSTRANHGNINADGGNVARPEPAPNSNLDIENNGWGTPQTAVVEGAVETKVE